MASAVAGELAGMISSTHGSTASPSNPGNKSSPGSGNRSGGGVQRAPAPAASLFGQGPPQALKAPPVGMRQAQPRPQQQKRPLFSANNPPMGTPAPAPPHPGVKPPYPDARSPQPTLMPNGQMVMPPPTGFIGAGMPPRVPPTFIPGMTGLLGR